jgi:Arc/MetJ-type ribon-helix-helix transcriptional regulator
MTTIKIPDELAGEIDRLAGAKKRSAYAAEILWRDVHRARQREALRATRGAWKMEDHPELADGAAAYIEKLRSEPNERFEGIIRNQGS